jgi:hypothetical protein
MSLALRTATSLARAEMTAAKPKKAALTIMYPDNRTTSTTIHDRLRPAVACGHLVRLVNPTEILPLPPRHRLDVSISAQAERLDLRGKANRIEADRGASQPACCSN